MKRALLLGAGAVVAVAIVLTWRGHASTSTPPKLPEAPARVARSAPPTAAPGGEAAATAPARPAAAPTPTTTDVDSGGVASYDVPAGAGPPPLVRPGATSTAPASSPYPAGLSADDERAMRVRHLVELRALVGDAEARLAAGDDDGGKVEALRAESAGRITELERWADDHHVTAAELDDAQAEVEATTATAEPPRP